MHINKNKVGMMFGIVFGGLHLVWAILVALGWAQPWINFVYKLHMIETAVVVGAFDIGRATSLVLVTYVLGYIVGNIFAMVWNRLHR